MGGTQTRTLVTTCADPEFAREFAITSDYPELLLGSGMAPSPFDLLLAAVGSSFVTSFVLVAATADVRIESMRVRAAATIHAHEMPGTREDEPRLTEFELYAEVDADASPADLQQLSKVAIERAPVVALCRLNVRIQMEPAGRSTP